MNFFMLFSLLLVATPVIYQLIYGIMAIRRTTKMRVWEVFILSLGLQIICTVVGFAIALKSFTGKCATPVTGIYFLGIFFGISIVAIAFIQFIIDFVCNYRKEK